MPRPCFCNAATLVASCFSGRCSRPRAVARRKTPRPASRSDLRRQRPSRSGGGFFGGFFGGSQRSYENPYEQPQAPVDNSRAPPPRKVEAKTDAVAPTTFLVVMGDGMADWLAYGLEDAFSDSPEVAIIRKNKVHSGLLRHESKGDLDWAHVARDILNGDDRQNEIHDSFAKSLVQADAGNQSHGRNKYERIVIINC